jgi:hypothetical protein
MNRMTLEQANDHFRLKYAAQLKAENLEKAKYHYHQAEYTAMAANAALTNFELALEQEGIDPNEA